jgi:Flp pilus assembly protein TadG
MTSLLSRLRADLRGATIVEFAFVVPVMLLLIMGFAELAYEAYVRSVLAGSVQEAGRNTTIRGASSKIATIDGRVLAQVQTVAPAAAFAASSPSRKSYEKFGYVRPEPFSDGNSNGIRDPKECFDDLNSNGVWDVDPGASGIGGDSDVVIYTVTVTYPRIFPLQSILGWSAKATATESTVLKNQPYKSQATTTVKAVCT